MATEHFTDEEISNCADFEPAITMEQVESLEEAASTSERGQQRRLVLLACSSSSEKLRQLSEREPDAYIEMMEMIEAFVAHSKGLHEMAESAYARMLLAPKIEEATTDA